MKTLRFFNIAIYIIFMCIYGCQNKEQNNQFNTNENQGITDIISIPDAPRWLLDKENIFKDEEKKEIDSLCNLLFQTTGYMFLVHTTDSYEPLNSFHEYSLAIDKKWQDKSQKYVIFIFSDKIEEFRLIQGLKTEQTLSKKFVDEVINKIIMQNFRNNGYFQGVKEMILAYKSELEKNKDK